MYLPLIRLMAAVLLVACSAAQAQAGQEKTLIIGIDGVQLSQYERLGPDANLHRLSYAKAYAGGVIGKPTQQPTLSGPSWITLLTGVWADKHGVMSNDAQWRLDPRYPSVLKRLRQARPDAHIASVVNWSPINGAFLADEVAAFDVVESGLSDDRVVERVTAILSSTPADLTFAHLDEPDSVAHEYCFGDAYQTALANSDRRLGMLLDQVQARQQRLPKERWLVLLTTDHGRDPAGCGHGGQSESEKTVFIAANQSLNAELTDPRPPADNPGPNGLYGYAAQTSLAPTVLRHMNLEPRRAWLLEGSPLLGATGVRKLRVDEASHQLRWFSEASTRVQIFRNGRRVAQPEAPRQVWTDPDTMAGVNDYVVELDDTPVAVRNAAAPSERAKTPSDDAGR